MRRLLGWCLGVLVRLLARTWRFEVLGRPRAFNESVVYVFWHGQQLPLTRLNRTRPAMTLVSWSKDGELQVGAMRALGLRVARGSSSRGGASGLKQVIRGLRFGMDAAFAVDGPRGPLHVPKPGAVRAAAVSGARVVAVGVAMARAFRVPRTWDHFKVPFPFTRVVVSFSELLQPEPLMRAPSLLAQVLARQEAHALKHLGTDNDSSKLPSTDPHHDNPGNDRRAAAHSRGSNDQRFRSWFSLR